MPRARSLKLCLKGLRAAFPAWYFCCSSPLSFQKGVDRITSQPHAEAPTAERVFAAVNLLVHTFGFTELLAEKAFSASLSQA